MGLLVTRNLLQVTAEPVQDKGDGLKQQQEIESAIHKYTPFY